MNKPIYRPPERVAVILGGTSGEREVSLESGSNILEALFDEGYEAFGFDPNNRSIDELLMERPDKVFLILHGWPGEDGRYQAFFDLNRIPYTGSGMAASAISINKRWTKTIWQSAGLPTPDFMVLEKDETADKLYQNIIDRLGSPFVVKPACEGSSLGIAIVKNSESWQKAFDGAKGFRGDLLVEKFVKGREFTFGVVGETVLPAVRIDYQTEFYDYAAKYQDNRTQLVCPSGLSVNLENELQMMALKAAKTLGCRGWYRVDMIITDDNTPYLLEVNTAPGMTSHSLIPRAAKELGWSYGDTVKKILDLAKFDE